MTLLTIQNLTIAFGNHKVVDDVSLTVEKGSITAIVGESGSGKTLTAQSILQLLPPEATVSGAITFDGTQLLNQNDSGAASDRSQRAQDRNVAALPEDPSTQATPRSTAPIIRSFRGSRVGMIFQEPMSALNPLHTIDRQIIEAYCWHKKINRRSAAAKQKLAELLDSVGLTYLKTRARVYPHQLSGGERQRVMIAMAISNDPDLLIADEPTTALDVTLQQQILHLLKDLQKARGMAMVFITHDLPVVRQIADQVVVMHEGKIVEQGSVEAIFSNPQKPYTKMLLAAAPRGVAAPLAHGQNSTIPSPIGGGLGRGHDGQHLSHGPLPASPLQGEEFSQPAAEQPILSTTLSVHFPIKTGILRRTTGVVKAVDNVALSIRAGETVGIVGESGSGKSSLAFALLKLIPSTGPIMFMGKRIDGLTAKQFRPLRRQLQLVFQDPYGALNPRMTVGEIIAEGLKLHDPRSTSHESRVDEIMLQVGLSPDMLDRYPHAFSGGQRQRIAIARAMVLKPALVVLDEPTSALDMSVQAQVLELLKTLQKTHHVAYLFISHDLRVIKSMAHQVLVLKKGELVEHGPTEKLFENPQQTYTKALFTAAFGDIV